MKFACPSPGCEGVVRLGDRACPKCGTTFSPFTLMACGWRHGGRWLTRITALQCPACHRASPLRARACPHCGQAMTVAAAVELTLTPWRWRCYRWVRRASERTRRRLCWGHLGLSLVLLWWLLGYTERHHAHNWLGLAFLSGLYLAAFLFLAVLLIPGEFWLRLRQLYRLTQVALVVNYFTALLLTLNLIGAWPVRASILAGLFGVSWAGAWLLCRLIWPTHLQTLGILVGGDGFDPSHDQGRTLRSG